MTGSATLSVNGENLVASRAGALFWPARETLILADLHFEKGSWFGRRGVLLPPYDTRTTLRRIAALCREFRPTTIISLGDAFHDGGAEARMDDADAEFLLKLMTRHRWIWILGNHDPEPPARFKGVVEPAMRMGRLILRHEPFDRPEPGEIAGHLHPCARVRAENRLIRRRCFASDGERLILPAFGAYTGGLNVLDAAYEGMFGDLTAWVLGERGVYPFLRAGLAPDAQIEAARKAG